MDRREAPGRSGANGEALPRGVRLGAVRHVILAVLLAACGPWGCGSDDEQPPPSTQPSGGSAETVPADALSPARVWWVEAKRAQVPAESIIRVDELLRDAEPDAEAVWSPQRTRQLRKALRDFLAAEAPCFKEARAAAEAENRDWLVEGKCYWAAWLIANAVRRPRMTDSLRTEVRAAFIALVDEVVRPLKPELAHKTRRELLRRFAPLQQDMLFPALKQPIGPDERRTLAERITSAHKDLLDGVAGVRDDQVRFLVNRVLSELAYYRIQPSLTEYWGHMKLADYKADVPRWPLSLAFVPNRDMNALMGWRRGRPAGATTRRVGRGPATTQPARASRTKPPAGTVLSDWSPAVGGLRGRLTAGPAIAKRLQVQVALRLWNVGEHDLQIDATFRDTLRWRLTTQAGKEVTPGEREQWARDPRWHTLRPGATMGKILGTSRWVGTGAVLRAGARAWGLDPGTYKLRCTLKVDKLAPGAAEASAWMGELPLAPVTLEVFADVDETALRRRVVKVRRDKAGKPNKELWEALVALVTPGMTPDQMKIALPPAARQRMRFDDRNSYFLLSYPLDVEYAVKAVGTIRGGDKGQRVLTSRPVLVPRQSSNEGG